MAPTYRAVIHALACRALGVGHLRTRPHRPQTNGKAERFIRTMLSGWAYGALEAGSPRDFSHPTPRERVDVVVRCRHR